jgi:hypothetical protein
VQLSLKILATLLTLIFFALGLSAFLSPASALAGPAFAWVPDGIAGLSAGRGILGGQYLALGLVAAYALIKSDYRLLYVPALSECMIVLGRLLSLGLDGFDERSLVPLLVEVFIAVGMFCAAKFLQPKAE